MDKAASGLGARIGGLVRMAQGERQLFVVVNVAVNLLLLLRSYVTMEVLDYRGLGLAALLQSVVLAVGAMQLGFLNGGYRLICAAEGREAERINNLLYSFFAGLTLVALIVTIGMLTVIDGGDADLVALLGLGGGVLTLVRTWMMNRMIAGGMLRRLNRINFWSSVASLATLAFIPVDPLVACLAAIVVQPAVFVLAVAVTQRDLLPTAFETDRSLIRSVIRAGFIIFLTGIFLQMNMVFERWYVSGLMGVADLGRLYLAILFVTLFQLIPTSLDQVFMPPIVRAHVAGNHAHLRATLRKFFLVLAAYCAVTVLALLFVAEPLTRLVLPDYSGDLRYVYLLAPGLIAFTLVSPFVMIFNVLIRYRYYLIAYGVGTALTASAFGATWAMGAPFDLDGVTLLRTGVYALMAAILIFGYRAMVAGHPEFRFGVVRGTAAS